MKADEAPHQWLTVPEACEYLRIGNTTLYAYMKDGRLPFYYLAGTRNRRIKKSDLDALLLVGDPKELNEDEEGPTP